MAHLQYLPGDPRLVDQLVYELKSKGIFDQFRKECIADVDTRPAYQNLRQRVESSVSTFLSRQCWKPDLNKNQLREKLRKHVLDGNYLEQGVERIVDQVVNPKVASVFMPQVEDLVYNYLGITRKKSAVPATETSNGKLEDLLPTDLEAVSPGSVNNDDKDESMDLDSKDDTKMDVDDEVKEVKEDTVIEDDTEKIEVQDIQLPSAIEITSNESDSSIDKASIPLPTEEIRVENIPPPDNSPPKVELEDIQLPKEPDVSTDIPLPDEIHNLDKETCFKPINVNSEEDDSSSDSSLRRNMSPLTPIRNFNNENSCDAQQAFENDLDSKSDGIKEPSSFRFTIETKSPDNSPEAVKPEKKEAEQTDLSYQFNNKVNINTFNTPLYEDSSNSNNLQIDYESDANSKINNETKVPEAENSSDSKKERKPEEKRSSHKSSHRSRDSYRHSTSKDKRSDSKQSSSRDSSRHEKKSKDDHNKSKSSHKERERSKDRSEKKDSRESSKHRSSNKSSSHRDSKSQRSSSSSQRHSSKHSDDKKSSNKERSSESSKSSKDKSKDSKSSSHRSDKDKDKKSSKSKSDEKDKKKDKKDTDDHYSLSGRGNPSRRSTDRDSNDGSSSSKGSNNTSNNKPSEVKKETKGGSSKSDNTSTSGESTSPCDKEQAVDYKTTDKKLQQRPIVRVETHLEMPIAAPPRLPFVPDVTLKKPKFAANFKEAKRLMKMRKFLDEEQKRMNQEAALLLEFQANVRPSLSQVYSSIPGPELEFACGNNSVEPVIENNKVTYEIEVEPSNIEGRKMTLQEIENIIGINVGAEMSNVVHIENFEESNEITNNVEVNIEINNIPVIQDTEINPEPEIKHKTEQVIIAVEQNKTEMEVNNDSMSNDNKPFSDLIDEITKYKNASENKTNVTKDEENVEEFKEEVTVKIDEEIIAKEVENKDKILDKKITDKIQEITIDQPQETVVHIEEEENIENIQEEVNKIKEESKKRTEYFEITIITEELSEPENEEVIEPENKLYDQVKEQYPDENLLEYFGEHEKYNAELDRDRFSTFLNKFIERTLTNKMYLINCDTYEENIIKEASEKFGHFEIVNYFKNGQSKLANVKNIVKDVNVAQEIKLPLENNDFVTPKSPINSPVFSPVKSECSFELSSEYDAKLEEMVNKTSRQEVMEIILGGVIDESPSEMPKIDYCTESNIDSEENLLKRKCEVESTVNNNRQVLTPNKIRKMSDSDQISSTTEETEEVSNNNRVQNNVRSKYLGRARRVGLSRPRKTNISNSPSSDKSVENYEHTTNPQIPNGKLKMTPRIKIQRYDPTDLYKPKLHYLSRRNNIS